MKLGALALMSLVLCVAAPAGTLAQSASDQPFFRLERFQVAEDVCILVAEDGNYHLEKMFRAKSEIYVGTLDANQLQHLRAMLATGRLPTLTQAEIHNPLAYDAQDNVQLAIHEGDHWRQLQFVSSESRRALRESLDPLLGWLQTLQKEHPSATRLESTPTRCVPRTSQAADPQTVVEARPSAAAPDDHRFFFRLFSRHFYNGDIEGQCTIVFADGSFHRERSSQAVGTGRKNKVFEGHLDAAAIQQLSAILDSPELRSRPGVSDIGGSDFAREGTITILTVPRSDALQHLVFSDRFGTSASPFQVGGLSNMTYHITEEKMLDPLKHWIHQNLDHFEKGTGRSEAGNECLAVKPRLSDKAPDD